MERHGDPLEMHRAFFVLNHDALQRSEVKATGQSNNQIAAAPMFAKPRHKPGKTARLIHRWVRALT